ncbi:Uncharacterised protein [Mycobacterium tuberculosis]|nr:Uncharacterised protein [Mycobacterium tuberculosis]
MAPGSCAVQDGAGSFDAGRSAGGSPSVAAPISRLGDDAPLPAGGRPVPVPGSYSVHGGPYSPDAERFAAASFCGAAVSWRIGGEGVAGEEGSGRPVAESCAVRGWLGGVAPADWGVPVGSGRFVDGSPSGGVGAAACRHGCDTSDCGGSAEAPEVGTCGVAGPWPVPGVFCVHGRVDADGVEPLGFVEGLPAEVGSCNSHCAPDGLAGCGSSGGSAMGSVEAGSCRVHDGVDCGGCDSSAGVAGRRVGVSLGPCGVHGGVGVAGPCGFGCSSGDGDGRSGLPGGVHGGGDGLWGAGRPGAGRSPGAALWSCRLRCGAGPGGGCGRRGVLVSGGVQDGLVGSWGGLGAGGCGAGASAGGGGVGWGIQSVVLLPATWTSPGWGGSTVVGGRSSGSGPGRSRGPNLTCRSCALLKIIGKPGRRRGPCTGLAGRRLR